eukprot:gene12824-40_t
MPNLGSEEISHAAAIAASSNVPKRVTRSKRAHLVDFEELPKELQTNPHIRGSYRRQGLSLKQTIWTLLPFNFHNETINVWSHIIGFLVFAWLTYGVSIVKPSPVSLTRQGVGDLFLALHDAALHQQHGQQQDGMCLADALQASKVMGPLLDNTSYDTSYPDDFHEGTNATNHMGLLPDMQRLHHHLVQLLVNEALKWPAPRWPMYVFTSGAMVCMALSAICHGFACCGQHTDKYIWRLDYAGITTLIVTSFFPILYYGMSCHPNLKLLYLVITCTMGGATAIACMLDRFNRKDSYGLRASMFAALGFWGSVPVIHTLWLNHTTWHMRIAFVYVALHGAINLTGTAIYVARIPEKWKPGRFDIFLSSHQWFHFAVVAAALVHLSAMKLLLEWRDSSGGVCPVSFTQWPSSWTPSGSSESMVEPLHLEGVEKLLKDLTHIHLFSC